MRVGRIYQTQVDLRDLHQALVYYEFALTSKDELESNEQNQAHLYIGEVYLALPEEYTPEEALVEFERALEIDPQFLLGVNRYWASIYGEFKGFQESRRIFSGRFRCETCLTLYILYIR